MGKIEYLFRLTIYFFSFILVCILILFAIIALGTEERWDDYTAPETTVQPSSDRSKELPAREVESGSSIQVNKTAREAKPLEEWRETDKAPGAAHSERFDNQISGSTNWSPSS